MATIQSAKVLPTCSHPSPTMTNQNARPLSLEKSCRAPANQNATFEKPCQAPANQNATLEKPCRAPSNQNAAFAKSYKAPANQNASFKKPCRAPANQNAIMLCRAVQSGTVPTTSVLKPSLTRHGNHVAGC